jgi:hypothetical protein
MVDEWRECWDGVAFVLLWTDSPDSSGAGDKADRVETRVMDAGDGARDLAYLDEVDSFRETVDEYDASSVRPRLGKDLAITLVQSVTMSSTCVPRCHRLHKHSSAISCRPFSTAVDVGGWYARASSILAALIRSALIELPQRVPFFVVPRQVYFSECGSTPRRI